MFSSMDLLRSTRSFRSIEGVLLRLGTIEKRTVIAILAVILVLAGLAFDHTQSTTADSLQFLQKHSWRGLTGNKATLLTTEQNTKMFREANLFLPIILNDSTLFSHPDLRVLVWYWRGCETCTADLRSNFNQALNAYRESTGQTVELIEVDLKEYLQHLYALLQSGRPPHLLWMAQEMLPELVEEGIIVPIDELYAAYPEVAADLPEASLPRFRFNDHLYGIPLGPAEEWNWNAYAITRRALTSGKAEMAFDLLRYLRARVPPHGLPELVIEHLIGVPGTPPLGEAFELNAVIRNVGEIRADHVVVAFFTPEGDLIDEKMIDFLDPDEMVEVTVAATQNQPGPDWYSVKIDPQGLIDEINKANNTGFWSSKASGTSSPPTPVATSDPFCIDSKAYQSSVNGMEPKVAFDGTNYLVVWAKQQYPFANAYAHQIYGARVSPSGTVLDTNGFVIASTVGKYNSFQLAFDGTNYLVVWEKEKSNTGSYATVDPATILYGARVSKSGLVLDHPPFVIEQSSTPVTNYYPSQLWHRLPVVVYTGSDYMVVYNTYTECGGCSVVYTQDGVYARRVSKAGVVGTKQQLVQSLSNKIYYYDSSELAFKQAQAFLFLHGRSGTPVIRNIFGSWISGFTASKFTVTTPIQLASYGSAYAWPFDRGAVAAGNANQYLAVWEYTMNKSYPDLHFGIATGSAWSNKTALVKGIVERYPSNAFNGTNYLAVYSHMVGCKSYLGAIHVSTLGVPGQPTYFNPSTTWANLVYQTDVAFGSTNFLAVFANMHPASSYGAGDWYMQVCGQLVQKTP